MDKERISHSFAAAASAYDQYAVVQKQAAQQLAQRIVTRWPQLSRIFEIGCGTGNLTARLAQAYPQADILATDISPAMLQICRDNLPTPFSVRIGFKALDGEWAQVGGFDLVASSLAFQWFDSPETACRRLKSQGAGIAVTSLVEGTFSDWKAAHTQLGLLDGVLPFLSEAAWAALAQELGGSIEFETLTEYFPLATDFVRSIKGLGAGTPRSGHQPVPLNKVLRQFPQGITATYRVAYLLAGPD